MHPPMSAFHLQLNQSFRAGSGTTPLCTEDTSPFPNQARRACNCCHIKGLVARAVPTPLDREHCLPITTEMSAMTNKPTTSQASKSWPSRAQDQQHHRRLASLFPSCQATTSTRSPRSSDAEQVLGTIPMALTPKHSQGSSQQRF